MSGFFSGALAAGLLATVAMVTASHGGRAPAPDSDGAMAGQTYRLQFSGGAHSCLVERDELDMRGDAGVSVKTGCEEMDPRLADARFWSEGADGTVIFTASDGAVLIEFAVADGVAYQSFQPGTPLASLIALN
jgi:hypothetical protein